MRRSASTFALASLLVHVAPAQDFTHAFDPTGSAVAINSTVTLSLDGSLRGVFDAVANPTGTRTILGVLGDPGTNADVPLALQVVLDLALGGALDGGFDLSLDAGSGTATIANLDATVGAGGTSDANVSLVLTFDTFRTVAPGALFVGGFPLDLPLGNAAVTDMSIAQNAPAIGSLVATMPSGTFDVDVAVPVELSFTVDLGAFGGGPTPVGPVPVVIPVSGTFDLAACDAPLVGADMTQFVDTGVPQTPLSFTDVPFDLPTILPPGQTANLLMSADLDSYTAAGVVDVRVTAAATGGRFAETCTSQPNSSGVAGVLTATGSPSVTAADLVLNATELPANSLGYFLMSREPDLVPGFGGSQGTLCLGGTIYRFSNSVQQSGALGEVSFAPDFGNLPSGQSFVAADSWTFQYWFRDANPQPTSNTSSAVRVVFCN